MAHLPHALFRYWRHSHEEGQSPFLIYRPGERPFPVARWRDGFAVEPSGVFVQDAPEPADRGIVKQRGRWEAEGGNRIRASVPGHDRVINIESVDDSHLLIWPEHAVPGVYVFESSYVNFAWGHQHWGVVIESSCGIYSYHYGADDATWQSGGDVYTTEELNRKYGPGRTFVGRVPLDELVAMQALIESASMGPYSEPTSGGADRGQYQQLAFLFDPATATHRRVLLATEGDTNLENLSEEARQLHAWLSTLTGNSSPARRPGREHGI